MKAIVLTTLLTFAFFSATSATIINIPDDYETIQAGINASSNGDTVLVHPGTYYEHVDFQNRQITLSSLWLTTGDTSYISQTIIDGDDDPGYIIKIDTNQDISTVVSGLTVQNANGGPFNPGVAISCHNTSPIIENCIIQNNTNHDDYAAAVDCYGFEGKIRKCIIKNNAALLGAGIMLYNSGGTVKRNQILGNGRGAGGGIYCFNSTTFIRDNFFDGNISYGDSQGGAGICISNSTVDVYNNTFINNYSLVGGGLSIHNSSESVISYNIFVNNDAATNGGAIYSRGGLFVNNTIEGNSAGTCGGIYCAGGDTTSILNTILWDNSGQQLYSESGALVVAYSDIDGGWAGQGNIDDDPFFCNPANGNYELAEDSPCVGTGWQGANMGAFGVGCDPMGEPCCDVHMDPDNYPVEVPPGGTFGLTGFLGNPSDQPTLVDVWGGVIYNGSFYELWNFLDIPLNAGQYRSTHVDQSVPGYAPMGTYQYAAYCGDWPDEVCDSVSFPFTVIEGRITNGADDWDFNGTFFEEDIPAGYSSLNAYPNPFNAATTISFDLQTAGDVFLDIYNLMGQRVASLVNGYREAGAYEVKWDAFDIPSGVYFYKLTAGGKSITKRMTLLK